MKKFILITLILILLLCAVVFALLSYPEITGIPSVTIVASPSSGEAPLEVTFKVNMSANRWWSWRLFCNGSNFSAGEGGFTFTEPMCIPYNFLTDFRPISRSFEIRHTYKKIGEYNATVSADNVKAETKVLITGKTDQIDIKTLQTYRNEKYGFEFKYPAVFSTSDRGEANGFVVALYDGSKALSDPNTLNSIAVFATSTNGEASFGDYLIKYPITDPNNEKPIQFQTRTIGLNSFYYARTERFEGVLIFDYYILHSGNIYWFVSISRGVDWTNPNLDEENDPTHATLKQILSTFKFLK